MKVIDLLNKIANGEEVPNKIQYDYKIFYYDGSKYVYDNDVFNEYNRLEEFISYSTDLNKEIKFSEEDKEIEEIKDIWGSDGYLDMDSASDMVDKINELIKAVNTIKKGE